MKLPGAQDGYVPEQKLGGYLLNLTHPVGASKARLFRSLGFDDSNAVLLGQSLLALARAEEVVETEATPHGTKYVVEGMLGGPNGRGVLVRTVWIVEPADPRPRLITAYPA